MGAGNYYFSATAGEAWSRMVYVDLQPQFWDDEKARRDAEFTEYLNGQSELQAKIKALEDLHPGSSATLIEEEREEWEEDSGYFGTTCEEFSEQQTQDQQEAVYSALSSNFTERIELPHRNSPVIEDAKILVTVGRMCIAQAYTYYGDRLASIVTPRRELQDDIYCIEQKEFRLESGWVPSQLQAMRRHNLNLLNLKRSVKSGALHREMIDLFDKVLFALHQNGLASDMSFRSSAWTSGAYKGTESYDANESRIQGMTHSQAISA